LQQKPEEIALRALRAADRSRAELDERLAQKGVPADERASALDELERLGYLDDARTAALRAERLAARGYGDAYIRAELERRGLAAEDALAALEPEPERMARFAANGPSWLARRGFGTGVFASDG
jgi:regulatory protein